MHVHVHTCVLLATSNDDDVFVLLFMLLLDASQRPTAHHSSAFLSSASTSLNIALLVLNVEGDGGKQPLGSRFAHLWRQSSLRLCADGAANRLHDGLDESQRATMLPDLITGDLDSLRTDVADFYSAHGVTIEGNSDQDTHDFDKCLQWLERRQAATAAGGGAGGVAATGSEAAYAVVAYGAFGGRLDQQMANLNMVYKYDCFEHFYLLDGHSLAFLLRPGSHVIEVDGGAEDGTCGLIPLGGRCERVRTTGLQWNLDGDVALEFGGLISSSNRVVGPQVTIETAEPLLWTTGLRPLTAARES